MHNITGDTEYIDKYMAKHSSYDLRGGGRWWFPGPYVKNS